VSEHRDEHLELCAGYALSSLDPEDRERLESHLAQGCVTCEAALADFSATTVLLAASASAAAPSRELRGRVLEAVGREGPPAAEPAPAERGGRVIQLPARRRAVWPQWVLGAAAAALAITTGLFWSDASRLRREIGARDRQVAELGSRLTEAERLNEVLSAPGAKVAMLEMTPAGVQELRARATYDPASRSAVVVFDHFTPPSGHDYELWALIDATPASLGVIKADASGRAVIRLDNVGDPSHLNAFAVSLEPAGGSPNHSAPSGPVVMLGKLSS
jgi:anti-sigma-K factor RskA